MIDSAAGPLQFRDRAGVPPRHDLHGGPWRIVPGGTAVRRGAHLGDGVVVMPPSYINVGAWVGPGTMVDSHVLVGSCAQIGARVHLAAGVTIGGVLELDARLGDDEDIVRLVTAFSTQPEDVDAFLTTFRRPKTAGGTASPPSPFLKPCKEEGARGRAPSERLRRLGVDLLRLLPPPIAILRGFIASGISRTRSIWSRPLSRLAPVTSTWSASWKRRSKAREAMPR